MPKCECCHVMFKCNTSRYDCIPSKNCICFKCFLKKYPDHFETIKRCWKGIEKIIPALVAANL